MAVLIPDVPDKCPNSERLVYERLGRELPDDWVVLHSLGLPGHETKIWGEADMIVLSTLGVFALEVKGGKVSCSDGVWTFSGDFRSYSKRESPWTQASGAMNAVKSRLQEANGSFKDALFGFGVVMPYTEFRQTGAEIVPEVLLDKRQFRDTLATTSRPCRGTGTRSAPTSTAGTTAGSGRTRFGSPARSFARTLRRRSAWAAT